MYLSGGPSWRPATTAELMMRLPTRYLGSRNPARASRATFRRCGAAFRRPFWAKRGAMPEQRESCIRPRRGPRRCTVPSSARVPLRSCPGVRLRACASAKDRNVRTARGRSSGEMERDGEYKGVRCAVCRAGVGRWAWGVTICGEEMTERRESLRGGLPSRPSSTLSSRRAGLHRRLQPHGARPYLDSAPRCPCHVRGGVHHAKPG